MPTPHPHKPKIVIGWSEHIDFPEWGIEDMRVKIDTGARTSALHVENMKLLKGRRVSFDVILRNKKPKKMKHIVAPVLKWAKVRSSTGEYRKRCFVRTAIRIGPVEKEIELTLLSREKMIFRMILGRTALAHDFIVDVSKKAVLREDGGAPKHSTKRIHT